MHVLVMALVSVTYTEPPQLDLEPNGQQSSSSLMSCAAQGCPGSWSGSQQALPLRGRWG